MENFVSTFDFNSINFPRFELSTLFLLHARKCNEASAEEDIPMRHQRRVNLPIQNLARSLNKAIL